MSRGTTNVALLAATGLLVATGVLGWTQPELAASPLYLAHRVLGIALVLFLAWKYGIARRSLRRRIRGGVTLSLVLSGLAVAALAATLALGFAWTFGVVSFAAPWSYSALNLHVFVGLALLALVAGHAIARRERGRLAGATGRRDLLRLAAVVGAAALAMPIIERFADQRRATGSKHAGSFTGNAFPLTIWSFDAVPEIDPAAWQVRVTGAVASPAAYSVAELAGLPQREGPALIDCTGGWWSEQRWRGPGLRGLVARSGPAPDARLVTVVSVTGHHWAFALADLDDAILATHVGGEVLSPGHGFPARLVVPERRGFQWIKWVEQIEVS